MGTLKSGVVEMKSRWEKVGAIESRTTQLKKNIALLMNSIVSAAKQWSEDTLRRARNQLKGQKLKS